MINIYCDESCHLELSEKNPNEQRAIVLGGISCPRDLIKDISIHIREMKAKHNIGMYNEVKWTKVSNNKLQFYLELVNYFFSNDNLKFRTVVFQDKAKLNYTKYSHDELYYWMYFFLLREMINPIENNSVYIDKKDTRGGKKILKLQQKLRDEKLDFKAEIVEKIQIINSKDSELMQIADILIGAVSYANRKMEELNPGSAKSELVELIRSKTKYSLLKTTLRQEQKFNIFIWESRYSL
ncbi:DUF3800 domain-containing protein [Desnuesiella massiliensis]|uniref:DUF3800 domain-containing protein n=1 Tax=Desnuesiella massiliensis TaxID=1650662 RepID=UPI0006E153F6|nr:DUF3800 domain-containing protein [Desnuesiella massiliensis]